MVSENRRAVTSREVGSWDGGHVLFLDLGACYLVREHSPSGTRAHSPACLLYFPKPLYKGY